MTPVKVLITILSLFLTLGVMAFAYPDFASDILEKGALDPKRVCMTCGKCTELMRAGSTAGCVIRNPYYTKLSKEVCGK